MYSENVESLKTFFEPETVALIGISTRTGPGTYNVLEKMKNFGYRGKLFPVNPRGGYILGERVYRLVTEIPVPVELAVISTSREVVPGVVKECLDKGVKGIIIITQGFADADDWGKKAQREIARLAKNAGVRVIGPNTMGVLNGFNNFFTGFINIENKVQPVGVVGQSGIFLADPYFFLGGIGLGADIGNACDVSMAELVEYYGRDPRIKVISLHMEDVKDGRGFMTAVKKVSGKKPVIVLKGGRTAPGARAAMSHTGSLAGEDAVYSAVYKQTGVIQAEDDREFCDFTRTFVTYPLMKGNRVAVLTAAGAPGIIAVDACAAGGLKMAELSSETKQKIKEVFPAWMEVGNPVDFWAGAMSRGYCQVYERALNALLDDPQVDAVLTNIFAMGEKEPSPDEDIVIEIIAKAASEKEKPIACWVYGNYRREYIEKLTGRARVVCYDSLANAARALGKLYAYWSDKKLGVECGMTGTDANYINKTKVESILFDFKKQKKGGMLSAADTYEVLRAYGMPVVKTGVVNSLEEAREFAGKTGYPLVMKVASEEIVHKSDVGGVKLNIKTAGELEQAYAELMSIVEDKTGKAGFEGILMQPYISEGLEVIVGAKQDDRFGPVVLYGSGGIFTEIIKDVAFRVAPLTLAEIREMIEETRTSVFFKEVRGRDSFDYRPVVEVILRTSRLISDFTDISEMDLNPVLVMKNEVAVLDARMKIQ